MLPVETCWPELAEFIVKQDVILVAPPGAGKSTFLPLKLLAHEHFKGQKIIMLQPRQIAVRAIADYLASQLGEQVGNTIGYRMRGEVKVSANTRLEIVTEGLLTRMLQSDPELNGVGLVIFDEFHERNAHADFALALSIESQQSLRPDLRLMLMSATLDIGPINTLIPNAKLIKSEGRSFPVSMHYRPYKQSAQLHLQIFSVIQEALAAHTGDILVFLPGASDIRKVQNLCDSLPRSQLDVLPLYGALSKEQQLAAITKAKPGWRKIVLATNIAETSLTIDGISVVIDSGKEKMASFNWQRKLPQLSSTTISKASATQRAGRAGRQLAGNCYRLWSLEHQQRLAEQQVPEILLLDVSAFYLEAKVWGNELTDMALLDQPNATQMQYATETLVWLEALTENGKLTERGRKLNSFGCHPRLANILLEGQKKGQQVAQLACLLCALLEHKPIKEMSHSVWLSEHIQYLLSTKSHPIWQQAKRWAKKLSISLRDTNLHHAMAYLGDLLCAAYPDYVGKLRPAGGYLLINGTGVNFPHFQQAQLGTPVNWLIAPIITLQQQTDASIRLAVPLSEDFILTRFKSSLEIRQEVYWSTKLQRVVGREITSLGAITIAQQNLQSPNKHASAEVVLNTIKEQGLAWLNWPDSVYQLIYRARLGSRTQLQGWPDFSDNALLAELDEWLLPFLVNVSSAQHLGSLNWHQILKNRLSWQQQQDLDNQFPVSLNVATGQSVALCYDQDGEVELHCKLQQLYGWQDTPTIANGKQKVTLVLLSPAGRALQKTKDLGGFWQGSYLQVKKEMKGRYPKHYWPDDPIHAQATNRTKKRM